MKKILIPIFLFAPMVANAATTAVCVSTTCPSSSSTATIYDLPDPGCGTYTTKCLRRQVGTSGLTSDYVYLRYKDCTACKSAATMVTQNISTGTNLIRYQQACGETTSMTTRNECSCGTQCDSAYCLIMWTPWSTVKTGYQERTKSACNASTNCACAVVEREVRCAAGYYGTASYGMLADGTYGYSGCSRCPSSGGVYGTSVAGSTAITSCYIPAGDISWTDNTGTYVCGEDSFYVK
ncbi:MAG: hypothetical protein E7008_00270 [Alphaproteobacteria bacterium]|nr:hypothetical protein [Alphaproteobacteria bacterium]